MKKGNARKASSRKDDCNQLEWERLFGPDIDHYMAMNRCQVLGRIFHHVGPQDVRSSDIWETVTPFIKGDEFQNLMDELIPSKEQQAQFIEESANAYRRRSRGRDTAELLEILYRAIGNRKVIWEALAEIMDTRVEEYKVIIQGKGFPPRFIQTRFEDLQKCLGLDEHERDILMVIFMQESGHLKLGDFSISAIRGTFDTRKLAMLKKKKYQCLFSREWDHDHFRHALSGGKSWKRRCRKRHQWERHCHSQFEMGWLKMGYKCYRHFILKKLGENGGTFTFNTSHRDDLEDILTDMELSGEILLDIGLDYIRSHASITAHIP